MLKQYFRDPSAWERASGEELGGAGW